MSSYHNDIVFQYNDNEPVESRDEDTRNLSTCHQAKYIPQCVIMFTYHYVLSDVPESIMSPPCCGFSAQVAAKQSAGEEDEDVDVGDSRDVPSDKLSMIEFLQPATAQQNTAQ